MSRINFIMLFIAGLSLFLFLILTFLVRADKTIQSDFDATVKIQDKMPEKIKKYLIKIAELGSIQFTSIAILITMFLQRKRFWLIAIFFILIASIELYGKLELHHPPPPQFMILRFQHLAIDRYAVRENTASFPSGHAARTAFLLFLWLPIVWSKARSYIIRHTTQKKEIFILRLPFGFNLTRSQGLPFEVFDFFYITCFVTLFFVMLILTFFIGFAKVYLGEHWISDVIGGWLLGSGFAIILNLPLVSLIHKKSQTEI